MTHLERWKAAMAGTPADRAPVFFAGTPEFISELETHMGLPADTILHDVFDIDYRWVRAEMDFKVLEPVYTGPPQVRHDDGSFENMWGVRQRRQGYGTGEYVESVGFPLADAATVAEVEAHRWPSADWYDYGNILGPLQAYPDYPFMVGYLAIGWFSWECRGMSRFLADLCEEPAIAEAIIERVAAFGEEYFRRILDTARPHIGRNFVCIHLADDWATQQGPLISSGLYRHYFMPRYQRIVDMAHAEGLAVEFHCCGSSIDLIPDFIETGFDILNPVQTSAARMDPAVLKKEFGRHVAFSGGIDVQKDLPLGTPDTVRDRVRHLLDTLGEGGGYIPGPGHNIQVGTPPANVVAMYEAIYDYYGVENERLSEAGRAAEEGSGP